MTTIHTAHPNVCALRWDLERHACAQPIATRWRILDCEGGAVVYDDAAGTVTRYLVAPVGEGPPAIPS